MLFVFIIIYYVFFKYFLIKFNFGEICWGKFVDVMGLYLIIFVCFVVICFVIEVNDL